MRKLLNTLYITNPQVYLGLDGENIVLKEDGKQSIRIPLHNLEEIVSMGYQGASPALMGKCADANISLVFLKPTGKFVAKVVGKSYGNILLRKQQYRMSDNVKISLDISKSFIAGKLYNSRSVVDRGIRDYGERLNKQALQDVSLQLRSAIEKVRQADSFDKLRGYEGEAATRYFSILDMLILQQKDYFKFEKRTKRPPSDNVNALLSFVYTLLAGTCSSALETVGLDPYSGYMHTDRPGRASLAMDLMEEFRPIIADRFVLTLINKRIVSEEGFTKKENGAVIMNDETRRNVLKLWQERKKDIITHPFLGEKIEWGLVPYVQAMMLARYILGDLDAYPPYLYR